MALSDERLAKQKKISVEQVRLLRRSRGTTNATLEQLPESAVRRAVRRLNYPDLPRARHAFRVAQAQSDDGCIPPNALGKALKELRGMRTKAAARPAIAGVPTERVVRPRTPIARTAGLSRTAWQWLGPGNIGGRTRAIVVHPADHDRIWAASAGGGIWHTVDGGAHWGPVDDFMANLAVACLTMDRKNPAVMYAGTGEGFSNADAIRGAGIFRTVDGAVWKQLPATATADFNAVNRLAVSKTSKVVLAATNNGIFRSSDQARAVWTRVLEAATADVRFDPKSSTRAIVGGLDNGEAWYSNNGGRNWKPAAHSGAWKGRVELCYSAKSPEIVYASVQMEQGEIWRSTDGGRSY